MWKLVYIGITISILFLALVIKVQAQVEPSITLQSIDITQGDTVSVDLIISSLENGLAGYIIKVTLPNILAVDSVDVVPLGIEKIIIIDNVVDIMAADINGLINPGDVNITLVTFNLIGVNFGTDNIIIDILQLDDDNGFQIDMGIINNSVIVRRLFPILPGQTHRTADLDNDGLVEDLNGNGRLDFQDIVLLFVHMFSKEVLDNVDLFDYNINGVIDFDDVVLIFNKLLG